jgi:hypothetical protein
VLFPPLDDQLIDLLEDGGEVAFQHELPQLAVLLLLESAVLAVQLSLQRVDFSPQSGDFLLFIL